MTTFRSSSPPHGFVDDPDTRRLLRSRPPKEAIEWAAREVGGEVVSIRAMRGGLSSAVHLLTVVSARGNRSYAVLRRYVRTELNAEDPDQSDREARALEIVAEIPITTPRLIACDPTGSEIGTPAILMTRVPGKVDWFPNQIEPWLRQMAEMLPAVHGARIPDPHELRRYTTYVQSDDSPPGWSTERRMWDRALDIALGSPPELPHVLVHRDFHPGNVLWQRRRVSGLVDWQVASIGPGVVDVGHCRVNLVRFGGNVPTRFTTYWEQLTGETYHPWADIVAITGLLDVVRDSPHYELEEMLIKAVEDLG